MPGRAKAFVAKLLFGVLVFAAILLGWSQFGGWVLRHRPLPGGGTSGECTIWFVGSSTLYRWQSMAQDMAPWQAHNRGVMGASVDDVAARMAVEQPDTLPGAVLFCIGENDIAAGASTQTVAKTLTGVVDILGRRFPRVRIIVAGLKPSPARWSMRAEQLHFNALMQAAVARRPAVRYIDPAPTLLVGGVPGPFYIGDGVHLNDDGYRRWGAAMRAAIEAATAAATIKRCVRAARATP